jgi:hypothetical protein
MKWFTCGITKSCHCEPKGRGNLDLRLLRRLPPHNDLPEVMQSIRMALLITHHSTYRAHIFRKAQYAHVLFEQTLKVLHQRFGLG